MYKLTVIKNAVIIIAISSLFGISVNLLRPDGIPFIQKEKYEIFVPCPEPIKEVNPISPDSLGQEREHILFIDARLPDRYVKTNVPGSINITFDYLYPVCDKAVKKIVESGKQLIVGYGDGENPDSGHELARELAGRGIKNVKYIKGGYKNIIDKF